MTLEQVNSILPTGVSQTEVSEPAKEEQSISLTLNSHVLSLLKEEELDINQLFIMLAMADEKIQLLDQYDEHNERKKVLLLEYQDLQIHGFLVASPPESNLMYNITDKGREFVQSIKHYFDPEAESESTANLANLAMSYLELFPKIKLPSGKNARVSPVEIEKKLKAFKRTYKPSFKKYYGFTLTDEDILETTKNYIARYAKTGYLYMVTSSYFIQKNEKSALADEIIAMKQGLAKISDKFEKQI